MATNKVEKEVAAEVKAEAKETSKTAEKTAVRKTTAAKKTAADKKAAPSKKAVPAKKTAAKKGSDRKIITVVEFNDKQVDVDAVAEACRADFKANAKGNIHTLNVYIKPEDNAAYYVVNNGKYNGKIDL